MKPPRKRIRPRHVPVETPASRSEERVGRPTHANSPVTGLASVFSVGSVEGLQDGTVVGDIAYVGLYERYIWTGSEWTLVASQVGPTEAQETMTGEDYTMAGARLSVINRRIDELRPPFAVCTGVAVLTRLRNRGYVLTWDRYPDGFPLPTLTTVISYCAAAGVRISRLEVQRRQSIISFLAGPWVPVASAQLGVALNAFQLGKQTTSPVFLFTHGFLLVVSILVTLFVIRQARK